MNILFNVNYKLLLMLCIAALRILFILSVLIQKLVKKIHDIIIF